MLSGSSFTLCSEKPSRDVLRRRGRSESPVLRVVRVDCETTVQVRPANLMQKGMNIHRTSLMTIHHFVPSHHNCRINNSNISEETGWWLQVVPEGKMVMKIYPALLQCFVKRGCQPDIIRLYLHHGAVTVSEPRRALSVCPPRLHDFLLCNERCPIGL